MDDYEQDDGGNINSCKAFLRVRSDGDYDLVKIIYGGKDDAVREETVKVIPAADKDFPNIRLDDSEISEQNRSYRTEYLIQSDWTQMPDVPASIKSAWTVYRQALRDLPNHANWPNLSKADWPAKPS
tara:strand:+ start:1354 stop:1734 length:381 start_codon:yes stop_codon:yes gene_type:complete